MSRRRLLFPRRSPALAVLTALVAITAGCPELVGEVLPPPPSGFSNTTTVRGISVRLDDTAPIQRYLFPVTIEPASSATEALFTATVTDLSGAAVGELDLEDFATPSPAGWLGLQDGSVLQTTFLASSTEVRLSLARNGAAGESADVTLQLTLAAPNDLNFDGVADDLTVEIGDPTPLLNDE